MAGGGQRQATGAAVESLGAGHVVKVTVMYHAARMHLHGPTAGVSSVSNMIQWQ